MPTSKRLTSWASCSATLADSARPVGRSLDQDPGRSRVGDGSLGELFGQRDDDALGAADVAEPAAVLVLRNHSNEFRAVGS